VIEATFVKDVSEQFKGCAKLFKLSKPVEYGHRWDDDDPPLPTTEHVVVSAVCAMLSGPETFIFPADVDGNVVSWTEIPGSSRGSFDIEEAIRRAGWLVVE
jgi:hypothetical protein